MAAVNILISRSRQPTRDGPPPLGLSERLTTPHRNKPAYYKMLHGASEMDGFFKMT
jgi:hypothetical protein